MRKRCAFIIIPILALLFHFNCDQNGLYNTAKEAENSSYQTTDAPPTKIYMFASDQFTNGGNFVGTGTAREGADAHCQAKYNSGYTHLNCSNVRAFVSFGTIDELINMPGKYGVPSDLPIVSWNGTEIAVNWADLFDATPLQNSMASAGVITATYWTGSFESGLANETCLGWTSSIAIDNGTEGDSSSNTNTWLNFGSTDCSLANNKPVLCICW